MERFKSGFFRRMLWEAYSEKQKKSFDALKQLKSQTFRPSNVSELSICQNYGKVGLSFALDFIAKSIQF